MGSVVGKDRVDLVRDGGDQSTQEVCGVAPRDRLAEFDEGKLRGPVDRDEEIEFALGGSNLGNLDPRLREFLAPGGVLMIPFFAFALGNTIDLHSLLSPLAGLGVVLALSVILLTGVPLIIADKLIGRGTGTAGIAASSTAGAAAANPVAIAAVAPQFVPAVQQATVLVAISIVVTSIVVPILTGLRYRRFGHGMAETARTENLGPALQLHSVD